MSSISDEHVCEEVVREPKAPAIPLSPHTPNNRRPTNSKTPGSASSTSTTMSDYVPPTPEISGQWYIDNTDPLDDKVIESQTTCEIVRVTKLDRQPGRRLDWMGKVLTETFRSRR
ncbi:hypothetical protein TWF696_009446 [Orbilia brochopaga]|uniref:Uncharacterized protein n=1 Tax=Orbilia brochopaga TaxID=3140254 RepID=A0AAV9UF34_9PEZI